MIATILTMREALEDPAYFKGQLGGDSWKHWRALLLVLAGEALLPDELESFQLICARQAPPAGGVREFFGVIGRRGGKSRAMAILAAWIASCKDHRRVLAPGERGVLPILASTREQAANLFNMVTGVFSASSALRGMVMSKTSDSLALESGVDIVVRPASFRATRGSTFVACIGDEISFWRSESSANPDVEILRALRPSLLTTGGPLIAISSPYSKKGELHRNYAKHFGKEDSRVLVAQAASEVMHPGLDPEFIKAEYEADPISARSEYGAEFRDDIDSFISEEIVAAATPRAIIERPPLKNVKYYGFVDASGGGADSFTLGIAHMDGDIAMLDCVRETKPPFSSQSVVAEYAKTLKLYGVREVTGDAYSGEIIREIFRENGIAYHVSKRTKSEIYLDALPLLNSGRISLLDLPKLLTQLICLERRTGRGRDTIDHPVAGHDDIVNASSGALTCAALVPEPLNFHVPSLTHVAIGDVHEIGLPAVIGPSIWGDCSSPPGGWPAGEAPVLPDHLLWRGHKQ